MKNFGFVLTRDRARIVRVRAAARCRSASTRADLRRRPSARSTIRTTCQPPTAARRIPLAHEVERRAEVVHLAGAVGEAPCARAHAAEIEAQHGAADAREAPSPPDTRPWCASCRRTADADARARPPRAGRRPGRVEQAVGVDASVDGGSSSSASSGPRARRFHAVASATVPRTSPRRTRARCPRTIAGVVIAPRWPVRSSTARAGAGNQLRSSRDVPSDGHDPIKCALAGDDQRRRGDARAVGDDVVRSSRARTCGHARQRQRRARERAELPAREPPAAARRGKAAANLGAQPRTAISARNSGPKSQRHARVEQMARPQCQPAQASKPGRAPRPLGIARRESQRDEAAERDAADGRALEPPRVEGPNRPARRSFEASGSRQRRSTSARRRAKT